MLLQDVTNLLDVVCSTLTKRCGTQGVFTSAATFEDAVRQTVSSTLTRAGHPEIEQKITQGFPDIVLGRFGIEVKMTQSDSWRCIANSVSEGQRAINVDRIFLIYGKMGGQPQVRYADYGKSIVHVRTSHVPRFEVDMEAEHSLFDQFGIDYESFRSLNMANKMEHIRSYARGRLKPGERLWWLEDTEENAHTLELGVRLYMDLPQAEKRQLRAEAALLCPGIVGGRRQRRKYVDAVMYMMTYRGVLCPQARDLFSAGSVAGPQRGGNYVQRALMDIEAEMRTAAETLDARLFEEYWGSSPPVSERLSHWLARADRAAEDWTPSEHLFLRPCPSLDRSG